MLPELVFDEAALVSALEGLNEQQAALFAATCMEYLLPGATRYAREVDPGFHAEIGNLADQVWQCVATPGLLDPEFDYLAQKAADIESRAQVRKKYVTQFKMTYVTRAAIRNLMQSRSRSVTTSHPSVSVPSASITEYLATVLCVAGSRVERFKSWLELGEITVSTSRRGIVRR